MTTRTEAIASTECAVCGDREHHAPRELHIYTTWAEMYAEAARGPQGDYPPLEVDGHVHSYTL